jgi:hypothetical protein
MSESGIARELAYVARFKKSERNHALERSARDFILLHARFQRPTSAVKRRILEELGFAGAFTAASFDLIMTTQPQPRLQLAEIPAALDQITLIEMKTTAKPVQNVSLAGYFFGTSETQYNLADMAGSRLRWAFVVMNAENDYGRPFFTLLTTDEVRESTRNRRVQFQVNFKTSDMPEAVDRIPLPDPEYLLL